MNNLRPSLYRRVLEIKKTGNEWKELRDREGKSVSEFKTRAYHLVPNMDAYNDYMVISLMQHHGVDTRALDFSESLLSSLFFGLEKYIKDPNCKSESLPCIWIFKPNSFLKELKNCSKKIQNLDQMEEKISETECFQLTKAPYIADRIRVQQGCFVFFPNRSHEYPCTGLKRSGIRLATRFRSFSNSYCSYPTKKNCERGCSCRLKEKFYLSRTDVCL